MRRLSGRIGGRSRPAKPIVYVVRNRTGSDLFGPLEEIYPELSGCFVFVEHHAEILRHALMHGVQIFRRSGRYARRATRDRLTRAALAYRRSGAEQSLAEQRVTIALGLRLSNRHPVDFMGFCTRLIGYLCEELGPLDVLIDGINGDPATGGPAVSILNGAGQGDADHLAREQAFVAELRQAVAPMPVRLVNCVGMSLRENLAWLARASFFIAPNGAGLAKLRWALDVPGFVLTSAINLQHCTLVWCYADPKFMEPPFAPMHMTSTDEVEDAPLDLPRTSAPPPREIPYPDLFRVDETKVFPRIVQQIRSVLAEQG